MSTVYYIKTSSSELKDETFRSVFFSAWPEPFWLNKTRNSRLSAGVWSASYKGI